MTSNVTYRKTIEIINDVTWQDNGRHYGKIDLARKMAIKAIGYRIPKKVKGISATNEGRVGETENINTISATCAGMKPERSSSMARA